jgi:hypothetical protein
MSLNSVRSNATALGRTAFGSRAASANGSAKKSLWKRRSKTIETRQKCSWRGFSEQYLIVVLDWVMIVVGLFATQPESFGAKSSLFIFFNPALGGILNRRMTICIFHRE